MGVNTYVILFTTTLRQLEKLRVELIIYFKPYNGLNSKIKPKYITEKDEEKGLHFTFNSHYSNFIKRPIYRKRL